MNKEIYDSIISSFDDFGRYADEYYGAKFIKIFRKPCLCYRIYFNDNKELKWFLNTDKIKKPFVQLKNQIDEKYFLKCLNKSDKYLSDFLIASISTYQNYIIGSIDNDETSFFIPICLATENKNSTDYSITVYTNNIENVINYFKEYIIIAEKETTTEFGIASIDNNGNISDTYFEYSPNKTDISLNYNDDLPYENIKKIIEDETKPSLMLFYGPPGTGKSSIIKNIIGEYPDKSFIFLEGNLLANAPKQNLMEYFIESESTIFILEDCEKILANRNTNFNPVIPVLLNITDGILGDLLKIKIICTFNTSLNNIDPALLRKGRLSLKYEFKELNKEKVRKILNDESINKDMSLADVYNIKEENDFSKNSQRKIGFN